MTEEPIESMGNQNVKPAKRPAQVYPFNDTDKKSRTDWTAGKSVAIPDAFPGRIVSDSSYYLNFLGHYTIFISSYKIPQHILNLRVQPCTSAETGSEKRPRT